MKGILAILFLLVLAACSTPEKVVRKADETPQHGVSDRQPPPLHDKVVSLLEKGMYRQALDAMTRRRESNQPPPGMEKEFVAALNGLLETCEDAMARNEFLTAGHGLRAALAAYPVEPSLRRKIRLSAKRVKIHQESCSARLMDQGVQEYRRGELDRAIRTWKSILSFNPGHREARKAVETATVQKKSLRAMDE